MTKTVLLRSRVRGNPQARFWRAVGVVTPSLTLIKWMELGIPYTSSKSGHTRYLTRKRNKIAIPAKHYWIRHFHRFHTLKTSISTLKERNPPTMAIFPTGVSVKANSTTEQPLKLSKSKAVSASHVD